MEKYIDIVENIQRENNVKDNSTKSSISSIKTDSLANSNAATTNSTMPMVASAISINNISNSTDNNNGSNATNLPAPLQDKLEASLAGMLAKIASSGSNDWDVLVEKPNYLAWKDKSCAFVNAKVETVLSYSLGDVFKVLVDPKRQKEVDDGRVEFEVLKSLSPNTSIVYERFKGVSLLYIDKILSGTMRKQRN